MAAIHDQVYHRLCANDGYCYLDTEVQLQTDPRMSQDDERGANGGQMTCSPTSSLNELMPELQRALRGEGGWQEAGRSIITVRAARARNVVMRTSSR